MKLCVIAFILSALLAGLHFGESASLRETGGDDTLSATGDHEKVKVAAVMRDEQPRTENPGSAVIPPIKLPGQKEIQNILDTIRNTYEKLSGLMLQ